ncbi:MAG: NAD(P)/FAD-dependent oxidoreductase [Lachnospiraceae bacterium]|nr:NAD(P)/FAD-dependent oxidoreductase [Lachnospiraceae bacterium]
MTVCVVGGGPAGMMAAIEAAGYNDKVMLFEQNEKLGKKLFLTGKGRCNLTNACSVEELFANIATNRKFLFSAFYGFDNSETIRFFNDRGLETKVERGLRVFPVSDHSSDVIKILRRELERKNVEVYLNTKVTKLLTDEISGSISGVIIKHDNKTKQITADKVIMATGGMSYPLTGSDGSGFGLVEALGIEVKTCEPSLVPFTCNDKDITCMQGLTLKNVGLCVSKDDKMLYSGFGELLFTHFGISGPLVLTASTCIRQSDYRKGLKAFIDLKSALSFEELDRRILRDFEESRNKNFSNSLNKLLPAKMITAVIKKTGIPADKKVNSITKEERNILCRILKSFEIKIDGNRGFDEAIITRGGVGVSDIVPSTMESRKIKGLFFAGEMIDTDALTGGFNLQIAWSTGHLAGRSR